MNAGKIYSLLFRGFLRYKKTSLLNRFLFKTP